MFGLNPAAIADAMQQLNAASAQFQEMMAEIRKIREAQERQTEELDNLRRAVNTLIQEVSDGR